MEPRALSSAHTPVTKIFAAVWIAGFGAATAALWMNLATKNGAPVGGGLKWVFLAVWLYGTWIMRRYSLGLKKVRLSGRTLLISNYLREVEVAADEIAEVSENMWINYHPITLRFRRDIGFGDEITFMPTLRWFGLWTPHPVSDELRRLAAGGPGPSPA